MNITTLYKYLYYKIYKFSKNTPTPWWSDWKASISTDALISFLLFSILFYYKIIIDRYLDLSIIITLIIIGVSSIIGFNYYLFDYKRKWKKIVRDFDKLPKKKNKIGGWLVFLFVCLVFANLIYSFYLAEQIDWSQYRQSMSCIKKAYQYLFYKIYRFAESMAAPWWREWKASIFTSIILLLFLYPLSFYYKIFINRYLDLSVISITTIILTIFVFSLNYYLFDYKNKWKKIIRKYDKLPKRKNKIGGWLVFFLICFIMFYFYYSLHLAEQIDWSQYRQFHSGGFDGFITDGSAAQDEANEMNQRNGGSAWTRPRIIPWGVK